MVVVNKITQLNEGNIQKLVELAKLDGKHTDTDVAKWIIAHSLYWKSEGYDRIIGELEKIITVE